jgi:hypothetical protein
MTAIPDRIVFQQRNNRSRPALAAAQAALIALLPVRLISFVVHLG